MGLWQFPDWLPLPVRQAIVRQHAVRFPQARAVLLYGSCLSSQGARFNDVDLLAILPGRGEGVAEKLMIAEDGLALDLAIIPEALIPSLPQLSLRMGLPVGLHALATGQVIGGDLPGLDQARQAAMDGMTALERAMLPRRMKPLHDARAQLEAALATDTTEARRIMALMALGRIAEAELTRRADSAFASPGMMARAANDPALAQRLGQIAQAIIADRADLLQDLAGKLPKAETPPLRIDPARFGITL